MPLLLTALHVGGRYPAIVPPSRRPYFWQLLLTDEQADCPGTSSAGKCLANAASLERIHVSAAVGMQPGDHFDFECGFPALAWLPETLGKHDLLIRWLAAPEWPYDHAGEWTL